MQVESRGGRGERRLAANACTQGRSLQKLSKHEGYRLSVSLHSYCRAYSRVAW